MRRSGAPGTGEEARILAASGAEDNEAGRIPKTRSHENKDTGREGERLEDNERRFGRALGGWLGTPQPLSPFLDRLEPPQLLLRPVLMISGGPHRPQRPSSHL